MKIEVFKHEPTGALFEKEEDYLKCVKSYEKRQEERRIKNEQLKAWEKLINEPRLKATSISDFFRRVTDLWNQLNPDFVINYSNINFEWQMKGVRCSHNAPIGHNPNFLGSTSLPTHFPGWFGKISGTIARKQGAESFPSPISIESPFSKSSFGIKIPGLNSGTGGGGNLFRYDVELFIQDFPLIRKQFDESLNLKETLIKEITEEEERLKIRDQERLNFIKADVEYKKINSDIDDAKIQMNKWSEVITLKNTVMSHKIRELHSKFEMESPYDYKLDTLKQKLQYVNSKMSDAK